MRVRAIDFVISHVTDVSAAAKFYREILGIDAEYIIDGTITGDGTKDTWTEFDTSPVALALVRWEQEAGHAGIALAVDDVDEAVEELREKGVEIAMEPVDSGGCKMAWIKDPWGNLLCIHKRHDGTVG
jgi:predicted enzyme related to lactoylglutathione lyase